MMSPTMHQKPIQQLFRLLFSHFLLFLLFLLLLRGTQCFYITNVDCWTTTRHQQQQWHQRHQNLLFFGRLHPIINDRPNNCYRFKHSSTKYRQKVFTIGAISSQDSGRDNTSVRYSSADSSIDNNLWIKYYWPELIGFILYSLITAFGVVAWEDLTCNHVLPSRHRTELQHTYWGSSTIKGMGFGKDERQLLINLQDNNDDPMKNLPSYNEVMLQHRKETVPSWKRSTSVYSVDNPKEIQTAVHTLILSLQKVWELQNLANDYQWDEIRTNLHSAPISDLPSSTSLLRLINNDNNNNDLRDVIGFDWGSCAWRHCGAVADAQEAIDELDHLLGVLEPYEAVFCLDIVERSIRDILAVIPWNNIATKDDYNFFLNMPEYVSKVSNEPDVDDDLAASRIDEEYFKALQELRID